MKKTRLTITELYPCSVSPGQANIPSVIFNLDYILVRDPKLAVELMQSYRKAWKLLDKAPIDSNDPDFSDAYLTTKEIIRDML